MSKFAEELNRRIQSGEPVHVTRKWFLECMAKESDLYFHDLSLQEQMFLERTAEAFFAWQESKGRR